jgi:fatty acid desaturase
MTDASPQEKRKRLRYAPILVTLLATLLLSGGSFYGCAVEFDRTFMTPRKSWWGGFFFYSFFAFAAGFVAALTWLIVASMVLCVMRERAGSEGSSRLRGKENSISEQCELSRTKPGNRIIVLSLLGGGE